MHTRPLFKCNMVSEKKECSFHPAKEYFTLSKSKRGCL